jgi:hypothetical protein
MVLRPLSQSLATSSMATAAPSTMTRPNPRRRRVSSAWRPASSPDGFGAAPARRLLRRRPPIGVSRGSVARHRHERQLEADEQPRAGRQLAQAAGNELGGLTRDVHAALPAIGPADPREQQAHVVVNLGGRADGGSRVPDAVLLPDGDGRANAFDAIDVGLLHPLEELPRVGRQRLDVAALPLGVDGVEGERRLPRPAHAGDDDQASGRAR